MAGTREPLGWLQDFIHDRGVWLALPAVFLGGLALNLTPCVYPMIPVTLAFFSSQAAGAVRRAAALALAYVLGISATYALLGFLAARTGALFGAWLQQPAVLAGVGVVMVLLALSMFGFFELRAPAALAQRFGSASAGAGGAFLMGLVVGVVAAPCIGPFILGLLLLVGQLGNPLEGLLLFFVLGLGMGAPYLVLGLAANRAVRLPKAGGWLVWVKHALGFVLLGLALFFLTPLLPARAGWLLSALLLLGAGAHLGWLGLRPAGGPAAAERWFAPVRRVVGGLLIFAAIVVVWPRPQPSLVPWAPYSDAALAQAREAQRPVVIDVYADWCVPCVEMDHVTFRHPDVVEALKAATTLRVDATTGVSPEARRLFERHRVYGAPTVLFFDRQGQEQTALRLLGFARPDEFLERLRRVL